MRKACLIFVLGLALACSGPLTSLACTTFVLDDNGRHLMGHNYDWDLDDCLIMVNKKGVIKTAYTPSWEKGRPLTWASQYGSVTFNQYGREFPSGGMNQAGLIIETMALSATQYPPADHRPFVGSTSQWKQFILDTCATVKQVLDTRGKVRLALRPQSFGLHFLLSDRSGDCAVIEFLGGKYKAYTGKDLPVKVLTNSTYQESLAAWDKDGPGLQVGYAASSLRRFSTAADMVRRFSPAKHPKPLGYAFDILEAVAKPERTQWRIVYDDQNLTITYFTQANPKMRSIDLRKLDFSCKTPVMVLDANAGSGDLSARFAPYSYEKNRKLMGGSFGKTYFLRSLSASR
ncbi:MAG: linear amide C-N hydrolase, partial [Desulfarculaceae bacterium]